MIFLRLLLVSAIAIILNCFILAGAHAVTLNGQIDVQDYGAIGDDGTDATAAINSALIAAGAHVPPEMVYVPTGRYKILGSINIPNGVTFYGSGVDSSILHVTTGTTASQGIVTFSGPQGEAYTAGKVSDFQIEFDQPDANSRLAMTQYVPAIYIEYKYNWDISKIRISRAWDGIRVRGANGTGGGSGTGHITDVCIGQFNNGLDIDGPSDAIIIRGIETHWVCGNMTVNQRSAYGTGGWGINIGRADDLQISDSILFKTGIRIYKGATGAPFGTISSLALDGMTGSVGMSLEAGSFSVSGGYITMTALQSTAINAIVGTIRYAFSGMQITTGNMVGNLINYSPIVGGTLQFSGGTIYNNNPGGSTLIMGGSAIAMLMVTGVDFRSPNGCAAFTVPRINITNINARIAFDSNLMTDCGGGQTAVFANISADISGSIIGNIGVGYTLVGGGARTKLKVANNSFN